MEAGIHTDAGFWIITGHKSQVGSPHLLLNQRLGSRLRRTTLHTHYVIAEIGLAPPLITFSLYLPAHSAHSDASFETILEDFTRDLRHMHQSSPGSFVLGGGDVNTQMVKLPGLVGKHTGSVERACDQERREAISALLGRHEPETSQHVRAHWPNANTMARTNLQAAS